MVSDKSRSGVERLDDRFVSGLYISLTGDDPVDMEVGEMREGLREKLTDEQIESVVRSYLLCLSVPETVRRLDLDCTGLIECPVCGGDIIHIGECEPDITESDDAE